MIREIEISKVITNVHSSNTSKWIESNGAKECFFIEISRNTRKTNFNITAYQLDDDKNRIDVELSDRQLSLIREGVKKIEDRENNLINSLKQQEEICLKK